MYGLYSIPGIDSMRLTLYTWVDPGILEGLGPLGVTDVQAKRNSRGVQPPRKGRTVGIFKMKNKTPRGG